MAFQASIFTEDLRAALDAAERLDASAVMINDHTAFSTDWMPFAGRHPSGYGIGGIPGHDAGDDAGKESSDRVHRLHKGSGRCYTTGRLVKYAAGR